VIGFQQERVGLRIVEHQRPAFYLRKNFDQLIDDCRQESFECRLRGKVKREIANHLEPQGRSISSTLGWNGFDSICIHVLCNGNARFIPAFFGQKDGAILKIAWSLQRY
jgi:hypothetical protein